LHRRLVSLLVLIASMLLQSGDAAAAAKLPVPGSGVSATEIERRIDAMTPEQRVGQLLIVCFDGPIVDKGLREMVRDWGVGGVIFYRINIRSAEQTRKLTASIRMMAVNDVVPFIAIDHEGGTVIRLRDGVPELPSSMALGATGSSELAFQAGNETGAALRQLGFTMNFAPVTIFP
jgi:beta-N-acetylhexosaminidase